MCEMRKRMPSINALRSFEAAARHQSFTLAAAELAVSPAAIGFQVKRLEEDVGHPLFVRKHRAVQLTPIGTTLMQELTKGFDMIEAAWADVPSPEPPKPLKVSAPVAVVRRWLFDEITPPSDTNTVPRVAWDVSHVYRALDGTYADAAIRNTIEPDPTLFSECVLHQWFTPLMRPDVARQIKSPSDLFKHSLINVDFGLDRKPGSTAWQPWFAANGLTAPTQFDMFCADTITAVDMAVKTGHVAIGGYFVASEHVRAGRLVAPFDVAVCPQSKLWFMCEKGRETEPEMMWFREAIHDCSARLMTTASQFKMFDLNGQPL